MENQNVQNVSKIVASGVAIEERVSKQGRKYYALVVTVNGKKTFVSYLDKELEFAFYKAGIKF